jgi:ADP-ribose pyrophosphatase YjhB (NUDIX family)
MPHIHVEDGQYDFTVSGYIVNQNKCLLIRHKKLPIWGPPSGHIELHQNPIDALYMEIREEAGIHKEDLSLLETYTESKDFRRRTSTGKDSTYIPIPFDIDEHTYGELPHNHVDFGYILTSMTDTVKPDVGESQEYKWFSDAELDTFTETTPTIIDRCKYALAYVAAKGVEA